MCGPLNAAPVLAISIDAEVRARGWLQVSPASSVRRNHVRPPEVVIRPARLAPSVPKPPELSRPSSATIWSTDQRGVPSAGLVVAAPDAVRQPAADAVE